MGRTHIWGVFSLLINIDISIDGWVIDLYLTDGNLIESAVIHILDDNCITLHICDDTYVSICTRVSSSRELYDSTRNWGGSCRHSLCASITYPHISISTPCNGLILCYICCTVSSDESSVLACIDNSITRLKSCCRIHCSWLRGRLCLWNWSDSCCRCTLGRCSGNYRLLLGSWYHELHTDTEC